MEDVHTPRVQTGRHFRTGPRLVRKLRPCSSLRRSLAATCTARTTELEPASSNGKSSLDVPRSPYNTGSSDIATAGPAAPLVDHSLTTEKTVVFVRHGMTTWNEQKRIQVSPMIFKIMYAFIFPLLHPRVCKECATLDLKGDSLCL